MIVVIIDAIRVMSPASVCDETIVVSSDDDFETPQVYQCSQTKRKRHTSTEQSPKKKHTTKSPKKKRRRILEPNNLVCEWERAFGQVGCETGKALTRCCAGDVFSWSNKSNIEDKLKKQTVAACSRKTSANVNDSLPARLQDLHLGRTERNVSQCRNTKPSIKQRTLGEKLSNKSKKSTSILIREEDRDYLLSPRRVCADSVDVPAETKLLKVEKKSESLSGESDKLDDFISSMTQKIYGSNNGVQDLQKNVMHRKTPSSPTKRRKRDALQDARNSSSSTQLEESNLTGHRCSKPLDLGNYMSHGCNVLSSESDVDVDMDLPNLDGDADVSVPFADVCVPFETINRRIDQQNDQNAILCKTEKNDQVTTIKSDEVTAINCYGKKKREISRSYLEFPSFLPRPSQSSLKHLPVRTNPTNLPVWQTVSEFPLYKASLVEAFQSNALELQHELTSNQRNPCNEDTGGVECSLMLPSIFQSFVNSENEPPVFLIRDMLMYLRNINVPVDALNLHSALKSATLLNPLQNVLPFSAAMFSDVLRSLSSASRLSRSGPGCSQMLSLDYMTSCLEVVFVSSFQSSILRRMRKNRIYEFFNSDGLLQNIHSELFIACQRCDIGNEDNGDELLALLRRLVSVGDAVMLAKEGGVELVSEILMKQFRNCESLKVKTALLESISFPLHRFVLARRTLEAWRSRSMTLSLSLLLVGNVKMLLDAYFSDSFLSVIGSSSEWMSSEKAEELVMLLYVLLESYVHTRKDLLTSVFWEKVTAKVCETKEFTDDLGSLGQLDSYLETLEIFLCSNLPPNENFSSNARLYLFKLRCLTDVRYTPPVNEIGRTR